MEVAMSLNPELLEILACPKCKGALQVSKEEDGLLCAPCALVYPVVNEIPIMLEDEAVALAEWQGSSFSEHDDG